VFGIVAELTQRAALAQEIPALVQLHLDRLEPCVVAIRKGLSSMELVLFLDEIFDVPEDGLI
jgi:hypothetical protein